MPLGEMENINALCQGGEETQNGELGTITYSQAGLRESAKGL